MKSQEERSELLFLNEKFAPAMLPEIYAPRQKLMERFEEATKNPFIYVGAPAGSGKTVSTRLWLDTCGRRAVWIGLDQYDDTLAVFYKQLATGLFSLQPANENMKKILSSPSFSASPVEHTIRLLSEFAWEDEQYALILDDMHLLKNREIFKSLPAVLRRLPHAFVTLILSRSRLPEEFRALMKDPSQSLILPEDLRFTREEIHRYFNSLGRFLTPEESSFAYQVTEGWALGVNAVAKSGQLAPSSGNIFTDYFETHIWNTWDRGLQDFCLRTAVVDEFNPQLAAALSGREDTASILEELSRTNTFLSCLHEDVYRYHHLFLDFLREKLQAWEMALSDLYKTAANYYKEQQDYSRALRFWLDSGDYKGIDSFLYLFLFENNRGIISEYVDFLRTFFVRDFPEKAFDVSPPLHILFAWYTYLTSQREEFERHMDAVYRNLPRIALADSRFMEYAILAYSVDHRTSILTKIKKFQSFGRYVKRFTPEGLATNIASFTHNLPYMHRSNLDYSDLALEEDSMERLEGNFAMLLGDEWPYIKTGIPACFAYERNQLQQALSGIEGARALMSDRNKIEGRLCVEILRHSILWQMGRQREAEDVMAQLAVTVEAEAQFFHANFKAYQTKLQLMDGDREAAKSWLDQYFVVETDHIEFFKVFQHFTTARAYMILGKKEQALRYLQTLLRFGEEFNRPLDTGEAGALLAAFYWAQGEKEQALDVLQKALETLQPYGFFRCVADEGALVLPVLKRLLKKMEKGAYEGPLTRAYVNEAALAAHSFSKSHKGIAWASAQKEKPVRLSRQQAHMLSLLAQGYRNAEIAELTGLKIPTIKSHTSIAYRKLGVNNAMDAVLKARELGLIE
ncbi:MAG: LuxR C-terminal-related transcriptional regulator [Bacillota bacterium]|nr:LuxR C-terminal-related transcriptional regulator [Bacillota bacterium]